MCIRDRRERETETERDLQVHDALSVVERLQPCDPDVLCTLSHTLSQYARCSLHVISHLISVHPYLTCSPSTAHRVPVSQYRTPRREVGTIHYLSTAHIYTIRYLCTAHIGTIRYLSTSGRGSLSTRYLSTACRIAPA
eukprot:3094657-Rhodomonas_salina.1